MKVKERIEVLAAELSGDSGEWHGNVEHDLVLLSFEVVRATCEHAAANPSSTTEEAFAAALRAEYAPPTDVRMETAHEGAPRHSAGEVVDVLGDSYQVLEAKYDRKARRTKVTLRRTWMPAPKKK